MDRGPMNATGNRKAWIGALCIGALVFLFALGSRGMVAALILGLLAALLLGALLNWLAAPVPQSSAFRPSPVPAPGTTPTAPVAEEPPLGEAEATGEPARPAAPPVPQPPVAEEPTPAPGETLDVAADDEASAASVKPSAPLAGEAELAARKGIWRYDADAGGRPAPLDAPRGAADDLTRIKGIGPALESQLHGLGIYHFDQIASWGDKEIAWMDDNLKGFRGRVSRDDWTGQARNLAAGDAPGAQSGGGAS